MDGRSLEQFLSVQDCPTRSRTFPNPVIWQRRIISDCYTPYQSPLSFQDHLAARLRRFPLLRILASPLSFLSERTARRYPIPTRVLCRQDVRLDSILVA